MSQAEIIPFEHRPDTQRVPRVVVLGLGGGGSNAVGAVAGLELPAVHCVVANTDRQALLASKVGTRLPLGERLCRGWGAGAKPDVGRAAALESLDQIERSLEGADLVFLAAGLGGGTGTGAAPVVAELARAQGALCVAMVTLPFSFEGAKRRAVAEEGLARLRTVVDGILIVPNDQAVAFGGQAMRTVEAFAAVDAVLRDAVRGILEALARRGVVNVDFADLRTVLGHGGVVGVGTGVARGPGRALDAAKKALASPLLAEGSTRGARGVLVQVQSDGALRMAELQEAMTQVSAGAHPDAEVFFGWVVDEGLGDEVRITVLWTGCATREAEPASPPAAPSSHRRDATPRPTPAPRLAAARAPPQSTSQAHLDLPPSLRHRLPVPNQWPAEADPFFPEDEAAAAHLDLPAFERRRRGT